MSSSPAADGMNYSPEGKPNPVCQKGDFPFAAIGLDHGHIHGQCNGLTEAGGELRAVYDPDPLKVEEFCNRFPLVRAAASEAEILDDPAIRLVAVAAVPSERCALGMRVLDAGKDYFTDKCPFTTFEQLETARARTAATGKKYMVYFSRPPAKVGKRSTDYADFRRFQKKRARNPFPLFSVICENLRNLWTFAGNLVNGSTWNAPSSLVS